MSEQQGGQGNGKPTETIEAEVISSSSLALLSRAEIDVSISTAHAYPRSIKRFREEARSMAILDEETAASCFYAVPRGGKMIEGPSVRLAEIVGSAWGNLRYGARVIEVGRDALTAQGVCHDLERNVSSTVEVRRRITNRNGQRFNEDMIGVTANAACSIALRNAIFKVVPFAHVKPIYEEAKIASLGKGETLTKKRDNALLYFRKLGVDDERLCAAVEKASILDMTIDDLVILKGMATAIKDGDVTIEKAFPISADDEPKSQETKQTTTSKVEDKLAERAKGVNGSKAEGKKPEPAPDLESQAIEAEAGERLSALQSILLRLNKPNRTYAVELGRSHGGKLWADLTADEQQAEIQRLEGTVTVGA